ncbi:P-loop containing nucleoside triphosphate hydrolase protein [Cryphonectria parasitica EP155]|uniref:P-loop containing nucleoside triphosphate hydrolase protein n=1 Tax=Cryphonectria parasitica (strain ATCC 38755 / EP155) TaxID=660469 RepID=A0A9P5CSR0_CRYP1|nr:P-loop containing nucleoside triphosphate hydrolase protein [Cryphonectria parasitica EP155]KAF3768887.1 P-loop containing nucleoside triphosphate hydrolase protein [Cryphonectria parasitica EP155]
MTDHDDLKAAVVGLEVVLVAILTVPAAAHLVARTKLLKASGYGTVTGFYEDRDGEATEESTLGYSDLPSRAAAWLSSTLGLAAAIVAAVLVQKTDSSEEVGSALSAFLSTWADGLCWLLQAIAALVAFFALGSVPRRPDVYFKGTVVDQQYTVSLLSKISFSWNSLVFDISRRRQLEMEDLPQLDYMNRSSNLHRMFNEKKTEGRLWWKLFKFHWFELAQQWGLVLIEAVLALFPQYVMYNLLQRLEQPRTPETGLSTNLAWVLALSLSLALDSIVGSVMSWWTNSHLVIPMNSVLQTLVFSKALKEHETAMPPPQAQDEKSDASDSSKKDANAKNQNKKDADGAPKSPNKKDEVRQSVINHMKLDSGRVTMFCSFNYYLPLALVKLVLAGGFLMTLLGWKAVLAGLASAALVIPLNTWISKKYAKIQFGLMKYRDGKVHLLTEALQGMRQIKYSALEQHWEDKIMQSRSDELGQYWKASLFMCAVILVMNMGPLLLACVAQSVYAWEQGGNIKASVIFASLGLFDQLDEATALLPLLQVYMMEAWTSCVRLEKYLRQPDKEPVTTAGDAIILEEATVAWPKKEDADEEGPVEPTEARSMLHNISLQFPGGKLSVVSGKTGSGKSLLLAAILGEVKLISGTVKVPTPPLEEELDDVKPIPESEWLIPSLTAFVSQTPWIETGTVQANITFGLPFVESRYQKVLVACSLEKDIELLVDGDKTEVGPKGVTLSGGQRWRVALARALYSRAGILILDDVLSAVDAHVGRTMLDQALTGELSDGRTRILATHHAELCLPKASYLVRLHEGRLESAETLNPSHLVVISPSGSKRSSIQDESETQTVADSQENQVPSSHTTIVPLETTADQKKSKSKDDEEKRETGRVKWKVYKTYLKASKAPVLWTFVFLLIIAGGLASIGRVWSFKALTENIATEDENNLSIFSHYGHQSILIQAPHAGVRHSVAFWIGMSVLFYVLMVFAMVIRSLTMTAIGLRTSQILFERMTHAILRAPLSWVDTNPSGRIMNRFTTDMFMVDRRLPGELGNFIQSIFSLIFTIAATLSVSVYVILAGIVLMAMYARVASIYIHVAREVKRINSISNSPIYDQFSSVLSGLSTVRAFQRTNFYMNRMFNLIDNSNKASWAQNLSGRWMSFRLSMIGTVFVTIVAIVAVSGHVDAAVAGFSLTFALRYSWRLSGLLQSMTSIELSFNATERVVEYSEIETEPEDGKDAPAAWPAEGKIEVEDLSVAYKESLPPVLKNLNFVVKPGERIGIIGRTGAGKSTLASVFFRLLKPRQGSVRIDNIDIAELKLTHLRSRLAIIPQDPFLFSGSLRSNLDMEGNRDDYEIQTTLQRVHLAKPQPSDAERTSTQAAVASHEETFVSTTETVGIPTNAGVAAPAPDVESLDIAPSAAIVTATVSNDQPATSSSSSATNDSTDIFNNLSMEISTGGGNLSQGQRQLVCLARALLTRPKIVIMDEATSAVDRATDAAIQSSLRDSFAAAGCTVLVIAHRLSTVADFDKILVLDKGRMAEMGTPKELLERGMARDEKRASERGGNGVGSGDGDENGKKVAADAEEEEFDGTGAFWDLVQSSAEKDKLVEMVLGAGEAA